MFFHQMIPMAFPTAFGVVHRKPSDENKAKFKAATQHFKILNEQQEELTYHFHFLTPEGYDIFFKYLRDKNFDFFSKLDAELDNGTT